MFKSSKLGLNSELENYDIELKLFYFELWWSVLFKFWLKWSFLQFFQFGFEEGTYPINWNLILLIWNYLSWCYALLSHSLLPGNPKWSICLVRHQVLPVLAKLGWIILIISTFVIRSHWPWCKFDLCLARFCLLCICRDLTY